MQRMPTLFLSHGAPNVALYDLRYAAPGEPTLAAGALALIKAELGAAGDDWRASNIHHSMCFGTLSMDAWRFD